VTSTALADLANEAGAKYIISPNLNKSVITRTKELGLVSIPGALTATEVAYAHQLGTDFVKIFLLAQLGSPYLRALRVPLNHTRMLAVGGESASQMSPSSYRRGLWV